VGWAGDTAQIGVVVAVHGGHRAAEVGSVSQRTRPVAAALMRSVSALRTRAAALFSLMSVRTVEVGELLTPRRSVAVLAVCLTQHTANTSCPCTSGSRLGPGEGGGGSQLPSFIYLFIYLIRQMAANSKIHNQHKAQ